MIRMISKDARMGKVKAGIDDADEGTAPVTWDKARAGGGFNQVNFYNTDIHLVALPTCEDRNLKACDVTLTVTIRAEPCAELSVDLLR